MWVCGSCTGANPDQFLCCTFCRQVRRTPSYYYGTAYSISPRDIPGFLHGPPGLAHATGVQQVSNRFAVFTEIDHDGEETSPVPDLPPPTPAPAPALAPALAPAPAPALAPALALALAPALAPALALTLAPTLTLARTQP